MPVVLEALGRVLALVGDVVLGGAGVSPAILLAALLGVASVAAAVALVRIAAARGLLGVAPAAFPDEDVDLPVLVSSSDPDADGHERSRAPGHRTQVVVPAPLPAA